ncbi:MAG: diguanylate cyclase domain-containing protein [Anaerostipes sp.]|uniref:sensor domain-containing diguanylate cyclase n=1 Tax=Anaerostipes sp. TaxID=1872530 RepID=UPI003992D2C2
MKNNSIEKTLPKLAKIMVVFLLILILPVNILVQLRMQHQSQSESSTEIFGQLEQLMEINQKDLEAGKEDFSKKAIKAAEMAAYFVKFSPEVTSNLKESRKLAKKLDVDEIHYFTPEGEIYFGTHPEYYGYTFHSGKQMMYFLPMLKDKSLKLCQEITPNTAEKKDMQYAAVWMEDGSGIVQIGMEPRRLLQEMEEKSLTKIISTLPFDLRGYLHIVDKKTHKIVASTEENLINADVSKEIKKSKKSNTKGKNSALHQHFKGERYCVYTHDYGDYVLVRTFLSKYPVREIIVSTFLVLAYVGICAIAVIWIIGWYVNRKLVHNLTIIVDNLKKIEDGNIDNVNLTTDIAEYDELIFYINQMLHSIRLNWNKLAYVIDKSQFPVGIFERNSFYKKTFINLRLLEILGIRHEEDLPSSELAELVESKLSEAKALEIDKKEHIYEYDKNGTSICLRIEKNFDEQSVTYYVTDVSLWWRELDQLRDESNLDFLTNLYNRRGFSIKLNKLFSKPEKLGYGMMIMVDADNLKKINDIYGHHVGDDYLREIAKLLSDACGISSVCARLGGDEFAIFLYGYSAAEQLETILLSLKTKRGKAFSPENSKIEETLEFSMGTAFYPTHGEDYHLLMHIADENMYHEKRERTLSGNRQQNNPRHT